jgi:acyl-CoA thioester hydrolase
MTDALRHPIRVRYHECDPQGIVFNANYLTYFDMALTELWRGLGGYEAMVAAGTELVVAEANVRYRAPLRFDDEIDLVVRGVRLGRTSMVTEVAVERAREVAADGTLRHVVIDTDGRPTPIPAPVRAGLKPFALASEEPA